MSASALTPCPRCALGRLSVRLMPYTRVHEGQFISVPNVKVYHCDVCGFQDVDESALIQLDALVGDFNVPPSDPRISTKLPAAESDSPDGTLPSTRLKP